MAKLTDKQDEVQWPSAEELNEIRSREYLGSPHEYFREQYLCQPRAETE